MPMADGSASSREFRAAIAATFDGRIQSRSTPLSRLVVEDVRIDGAGALFSWVVNHTGSDGGSRR